VDEPASFERRQDLTEAEQRIRRTLLEKRITLAVRDYEFGKTLKMLTEQTGVKITVPDYAESKVSLDVKDVPLKRVLELLARPCGLDIEIAGREVVIR
jgi:type II secretory pathway component HofQ